jgi:uncharacterized protein DUF1579
MSFADPERRFDFLEGTWEAVCRVPRGDGWDEARGTMTATWILDGRVSLEMFEGIYHGGPLKGIGLRAFDRATGEWAHTWTDNLDPGRFHEWRGKPDVGRIDLHGKWEDPDGRTVLSRLSWSRISFDRAHWESARSSDSGKTWTVHWVIDFRRTALKQ